MKTEDRTRNAPNGRQRGAAELFVERMLGVGRVGFSLEELCAASGLSATAARFQLLRLREKVVRVSPRQRFYLIVTPEHRGVGAPPPGWWLEDYFAWLGRPYYVALQSAASIHGSNPQAVQLTQVMTDRPTRLISLGRLRVRFYVKRAIEKTPTIQPPGAPAPLRVSAPEATALDLVRYAKVIGGIERAAETIRPLLPGLRGPALKRALNAGTEVAVAQRFGFVLDAVGQKSLAAVVHNFLPAGLTPVVLSPEKKGKGALVERWKVVSNSAELKV